MTKICTKCGESLPATAEYFHRRKDAKCGLRSWCKKCRYAATTIWRKRNLEKCREHDKTWRERHSGKRRKCQKEYAKTFRGYVSFLAGAIKARCTNRNNPGYKYYGERGIRCLFTSKELYDWLIKKEIDPRGLNIHRIDNDGDYILDNITFLTASEHTSLHKRVKV